MQRVNGTRIVKPAEANVRCSCIVDLISRLQRPYLFKVTVTGEPPHAVVRVYEISAKSDSIAAFEGIKIFMREMESKVHPVLALLQ